MYSTELFQVRKKIPCPLFSSKNGLTRLTGEKQIQLCTYRSPIETKRQEQVRNGIGNWGFKGKSVIHSIIRKTDICSAIHIDLADKKVISANSSLSGPAPLSEFFR